MEYYTTEYAIHIPYLSIFIRYRTKHSGLWGNILKGCLWYRNRSFFMFGLPCSWFCLNRVKYMWFNPKGTFCGSVQKTINTCRMKYFVLWPHYRKLKYLSARRKLISFLKICFQKLIWQSLIKWTFFTHGNFLKSNYNFPESLNCSS